MVSLRRRSPSVLVGLTFEGRRVEGVVLQRTNGSLQVKQSFHASLALDPLTNDPELVGRELRNRLDEADVRVRTCSVCVPLNWALTCSTKLPDVSEADLQDFLTLEAERGFPYSPEDLAISVSRYRSPGGEKHATLVAIPKNHLSFLERTLRAAKLKPISFSFGIAAIQESRESAGEGIMALAVGEEGFELQISAGGGVILLRALKQPSNTEGGVSPIDGDLLAREIRITLGQLPSDLRQTIRRLRLFGRPELVEPVMTELRSRVESMGLSVELGTIGDARLNGQPVPMNKNSAGAVSLASRLVRGQATAFEFLPPKTSPWTQLTTRVSSRRIVWLGGGGGGVVLLVVAAFLVQHLRLSSLEREWVAIEPIVTQIEATQENIRKFRPWFDESFRSLRILTALTGAFPEDGVLSAKTLSIRNLSQVSCTGQARDNQSVMRMTDQLRAVPQVSALSVPQTRGNRTPLEFNFNFTWKEGGSVSDD